MKFLQNHKRWLIGAFVVLALALIVWLVGPLIDIGDPRVLDSVGRRAVVILLILLGWLAWEGARLWRERQRNRQLIDQLAQGESAETAQSRQEAEALRARFVEALSTLKSTRLGGSRMLYQLPWYMFIGAPGSGKTTALVNSGLKFPLAQAGSSGAALGGIGGTRNCDWWFTDDAVLIDTAGRYTTQDSNAKVDQSAWETFLDLLKRYRPRQPINGILVTLSIGDLLTQGPAERALYASVVRQRIEDLQKHLGLQFPVYVLVTKCDLISGFNEFYAGWDVEQRAQVWGTTFDFDLKTRVAGDARKAFADAFPALVERLNRLLIDRLQEERDAERRTELYPFPQQFAAIGPLVTEFLEAAFSASKYSDMPIVRGVYFTSGTQQGAPIDRVLASLAGSLALGGSATRRAALPHGSAKSYFIQRMLTQVVFPEAGLAGHSEQREQRLRLLSWGLTGLCGVVGLGLTAAWTASYLGNRAGLQRAEAAAQTARTSLAVVPAPGDGDLSVLVEALDQMQKIPTAVHDPVDQPVLGMRWGLYQGRKVDDQIQERYRLALQQGLLPRIALQLERIMAAPQSKPEHVYAALKTYLMMYEPKRFDAGFFLGSVGDLWRSTSMDAGVREAAEGHLRALVTAGDLQVARFHPLNQPLVASARDRVAGLSLSDRAYNLLRLSVTGPGPVLRLSEVLGPAGVSVLERSSGVSLSDPVPFVFTREGYRKAARPRIRELVSELTAEESWVLGGRASGVGSSNAQEVEVVVQRRLLADYQSHWKGVLSDIRVRRIDGIKTAMNTAQTLGQPDSPLKRLAVMVADQTRLSAPDIRAEAASAAEDNARRKLKEVATSATTGIFGSQAGQVVDAAVPGAAGGRTPEQDLEDQFSDLRRLVGDGKGGSIESALGQFNNIFTELVAMQQKLSSGQGIREIPPAFALAEGQATQYGDPVTKAIMALVAYAKQEASGGVQKEVKAGVGGAASMCQRAIPGRYPFARSAAQDVGVQDFVNVFKAGGDLDTYFNTSLASYVDKSGGVWRLKATGEGAPPVSAATLRQFQNADAIRTAFLGGGVTPSVVVDVSVVSGDAEVGIDYDGNSNKLRVGANGVRLAWPARPGARLTLNGQPVVSVDGAWALFRLIDKGTIDPSSTGDRIRVSYATASGSRSVMEIRTGSAAFNPFRLRELESFACPKE